MALASASGQEPRLAITLESSLVSVGVTTGKSLIENIFQGIAGTVLEEIDGIELPMIEEQPANDDSMAA